MRVIHKIDPHTCTSVTFRASWVDPGSYGLVKAKELTFGLGLGPCGRFVTLLRCEVDEHFVKIEQWSQPDDQPFPECKHLERVQRMLERSRTEHLRQEKFYRDSCIFNPGYWTGPWWNRKFVHMERQPFEFVPKRGEFFSAKEIELVDAILKDARESQWAWRKRNEIKQFVYKMSDVHGRIVTIK
ncbi:hypothetical protein HOS76_gp22 [Pseudomonas phage Henninger]|uniref:Uncharacterized protein n=1 Tax=Pseudomonas phage Henninger TaxID=2079287 RepID=A0A2K9VH84_9CAUD|nr:hypothetical protein HOS76_gp22 [Pseudomonas phage Henninger]AUV61716.1 hypothetical protein PsPhHenninger_gp31 [Pseudomonas phage Henninger]